MSSEEENLGKSLRKLKRDAFRFLKHSIAPKVVEELQHSEDAIGMSILFPALVFKWIGICYAL